MIYVGCSHLCSRICAEVLLYITVNYIQLLPSLLPSMCGGSPIYNRKLYSANCDTNLFYMIIAISIYIPVFGFYEILESLNIGNYLIKGMG